MSSEPKPKVLVVDDEQAVLNALFRTLRKDFDVLLCLNGEAGRELLREQEISAILADQRMPSMTGVEFFQHALKIQPDIVKVLITGYTDIEAIIDAVNDGQIFYYIQKPWEPDDLLMVMRRAVERYQLVKENRRLLRELEIANQRLKGENIVLRQEVEKHYTFDNIIGTSRALEQVFDLMKKIIPTETMVLLEGETGTGKELVARAIHHNGPRQEKTFVTQNCAALPDTLLESSLFGYKKGAFTDAASDKKGLFELADGGTIFLDEIGDMSPAMQQRMLRVLQEGEIRPLGSDKTVKVDVRVISATNKDLNRAVREGLFREDLFYRLNVFPIRIPPLRERREDIPLLTEYFVRKFALKNGKVITGIDKTVLEELIGANFPGNVRELENVLERAVILAEDNSSISSELLQIEGERGLGIADTEFLSANANTAGSLKEITETVEKQYIIQALQKFKGNISKAAESLGLSRLGLYKKIERFGINAGKYKLS